MIWLVLALCLLPIAAMVLWPFLKMSPHDDNAQGEDWNRASLKAALAAVDKDEARGVLSADAAEAQRVVIANKAQDLMDIKTEARPQKTGRLGFIIAAGVLGLAPVILFGAYSLLGTADPQLAQKTALAQQQAQQPQTLAEAIALVEKDIETNPEEGRLWAVLSDLKIRNQDLIGAEAALEKAVNLPAANDKEKAQLWLILAMTRRSQGLDLSDPNIIAPLEKSLALDAESPAGILLKRAASEAEEPESKTP